MPIRFTVGGIQFEADTPEEALEFAKAHGEINGKPEKARRGRSPKIAVEYHDLPPLVAKKGDCNKFFESLKDHGRKVVAVLAEFPEGISTDALAKKSGVPSMSLPPVMRHIRGMAAKAGFDGEKILKRRQVLENRKPKSMYVLNEEVASEIGKK